MKKANFFYLDEYHKYLNFIEECKEKTYENEVVHKHHIIPTHVCVDDSLKNYTINLNVDDHAKAHILFSKIWPKGTYEYGANIWSAQILKGEHGYNILHDISESRKGNLNGFYGKKHTKESHQKMTNGLVLYWKNKVRNYDDQYGKERSKKEKEKRAAGVKKSWANISKEDKEKRIKNASIAAKKAGKSKRGLNPAAKKCEFNGIVYNCLADAKEKTGLSIYMMKKTREFKIME